MKPARVLYLADHGRTAPSRRSLLDRVLDYIAGNFSPFSLGLALGFALALIAVTAMLSALEVPL